MKPTEHRIFDVLDSCKLTLDWIDAVHPIALGVIPPEHLENVKILEKLGIVFRRNNKTLEVAKQRLRRVLEAQTKSK